jgi:hypothetical protein
MKPDPTAITIGKNNAKDNPTPSDSAPITVLAPIEITALKRLRLLTAQAVETPGMWPAAE